MPAALHTVAELERIGGVTDVGRGLIRDCWDALATEPEMAAQ